MILEILITYHGQNKYFLLNLFAFCPNFIISIWEFSDIILVLN